MFSRLLSAALAACLCLSGQAWGFSYRGQSDGVNTGATDNGEAIAWHQQFAMIGLNFGAEWNDHARLALQQWNQAGASFQWYESGFSAKPCVNDGINSTAWTDTSCGADWGSIIATTRVSMSRIGGKWYINDTDIVFNAGLKFDAYAGAQRYDADGKPVYDFIRVALHEFGHAAGLLHPDEAGQKVAAIMNTGHNSLVLDRLQDDDIDGIRHLYSARTSDDEIVLEGYRNYRIADGRIQVALNGINNFRAAASRPLTLEIRASRSLDSRDYHLLGSVELAPLAAGEQRRLGELSSAYTPPPAGLHSVSLTLLEENNDQPLYNRAIGYMEIESDTLHTGTSVSSGNGGGGGAMNLYWLAALMLSLWQQNRLGRSGFSRE